MRVLQAEFHRQRASKLCQRDECSNASNCACVVVCGNVVRTLIKLTRFSCFACLSVVVERAPEHSIAYLRMNNLRHLTIQPRTPQHHPPSALHSSNTRIWGVMTSNLLHLIFDFINDHRPLVCARLVCVQWCAASRHRLSHSQLYITFPTTFTTWKRYALDTNGYIEVCVPCHSIIPIVS